MDTDKQFSLDGKKYFISILPLYQKQVEFYIRNRRFSFIEGLWGSVEGTVRCVRPLLST